MVSKNKCILLTVGVLFALGLLLLMFVPWVVIKSRYEKTTTSARENYIHNSEDVWESSYSTKAYQIDGTFVDTVTLKLLSQGVTGKAVTLHMYPTPPPLDVHKSWNHFTKSISMSPAAFRCVRFYLNEGSTMNMTYCASGPTRLVLIRGNHVIKRLDNVKPPLAVLSNKTFGAVNCSFVSGRRKANISVLISKSNIYQFCIEGTSNDTSSDLYLSDILFVCNTTQYNLSTIRGRHCSPSDEEYSSCVLDVPDSSSATAVVEVNHTTNTFINSDYSLKTSVRPAAVWPYTGVALAATGLLVLLGLFYYKKFKYKRERSNESERLLPTNIKDTISKCVRGKRQRPSADIQMGKERWETEERPTNVVTSERVCETSMECPNWKSPRSPAGRSSKSQLDRVLENNERQELTLPREDAVETGIPKESNSFHVLPVTQHNSSVSNPNNVNAGDDRFGESSLTDRGLQTTLAATQTSDETVCTSTTSPKKIFSVDSALSTLTLNVDRDGGYAHKNDVAIFVPEGAVDEATALTVRVYIDDAQMPPVDSSYFVFSPVLSFEPHGKTFNKPIQVTFPVTAVPQHWLLQLLRADCRDCDVPSDWDTVLEYNTETGLITNIVKTNDCSYDLKRRALTLTHFCKHCFLGKPIYHSLKGQKQVYCSVFGYQPGANRDRWILDVYLHDHCQDIFDDIKKNEFDKEPKRSFFNGPESLCIDREGEIRIKIEGESWDIQEPVQTRDSQTLWKAWSKNTVHLEFVVSRKRCMPEFEMKVKMTACGGTETVCVRVSPPIDKDDSISENSVQSLTDPYDSMGPDNVVNRQPVSVSSESSEIDLQGSDSPPRVLEGGGRHVTQVIKNYNFNIEGQGNVTIGEFSHMEIQESQDTLNEMPVEQNSELSSISRNAPLLTTGLDVGVQQALSTEEGCNDCEIARKKNDHPGVDSGGSSKSSDQH